MPSAMSWNTTPLMPPPDAGKRQQPLAVGNGYSADIQFLNQHLSHLHTILFVESLTQDPLGRGRHFQRGGGKSRGIFFKHRPLIQQNTHKQRGADGIRDHHRRGDTLYQVQRILKGSRNEQDYQHLYQFSEKGNRPGGKRAEHFIRATAPN